MSEGFLCAQRAAGVFLGDLVVSILFHCVKADHLVCPGLEGHSEVFFCSL